MKILIVEDDALLRQGLSLAMSGEGYAVDCEANAAQGAALLQNGQYNLVVLDLGLPDRDGAHLLRQWRKEQQDLPVLILTARDTLSDRVNGLDAGLGQRRAGSG